MKPPMPASESSNISITTDDDIDDIYGSSVRENGYTIEPRDGRGHASRQNGNSTSIQENGHEETNCGNDEANYIEDLIKNKKNEELNMLLYERSDMINIACNPRFLYQPIHMAAKYNNLEFMRNLAGIESSVIDVKNINGFSVLHISALYRSADCSHWLVEHFPYLINQVNCYGNTALHYVTWANDTTTLKLLVDKGANMLVNNVYGNNPLDWGKERGCTECLEELQKALVESGLTDNGKYSYCETVEEYQLYLN